MSASFSYNDFLKWELGNDEKHEYFGGEVFALAGASDAHDLVAVIVLSALHQHLKGRECRVYSSDMKLKVLLKHADATYYPDSMVVCDSSDSDTNYKTKPKVLIEVMSNFRRNHVEKFMICQSIASLEEYVVIDQNADEQKAWVYRRATGWEQEIIQSGGSIEIPSIEFSASLESFYDEA